MLSVKGSTECGTIMITVNSDLISNNSNGAMRIEIRFQLTEQQMRETGKSKYIIFQDVCLWGLPWWSSGWEPACQYGGHGFDPWSGRIPLTKKQLSLCATTTELVLQSPPVLQPRARAPQRETSPLPIQVPPILQAPPEANWATNWRNRGIQKDLVTHLALPLESLVTSITHVKFALYNALTTYLSPINIIASRVSFVSLANYPAGWIN